MKRISIRNLVYVIAYMSFLVGYIISASRIVEVYPGLMVLRSALRAFGYASCIFLIMQMRLRRSSLFLVCIVAIIVLLSRYITGIDILVVDFMLITSVQGVDKKSLIKTDLIVRITCLIILYMTVRLGIVSDYIGYRDGMLIRHSWGFNHPNRLGVHLLAISLDILYLNHGEFKKSHWIELLFTGGVAYYIADSRTAVICIAIVVIAEIIYLIIRKIKDRKKGRKLKIITYSILTLSILISFILPYLFNSGRMIVLGGSNTIGSRIIKTSYALENYGFTLFGQKLDVVTISESIEKGTIATGIDNLYVYLLVNFGIIFFVTLIGLCYYTVHYLDKKSNYVVMICFFVFFIFGTVENTASMIECNLFLVFIGEAILDLRNKTLLAAPNINRISKKKQKRKIKIHL